MYSSKTPTCAVIQCLYYRSIITKHINSHQSIGPVLTRTTCTRLHASQRWLWKGKLTFGISLVQWGAVEDISEVDLASCKPK